MSFRNSYPAWRAYVFGVDITEDVSSMVLNWNDSRAPNSAEIVLGNLNDKYIITKEDIYTLYNDVSVDDLDKVGDGPLTNEEVDSQLRQNRRRVRDRLAKSFSDETKGRVLSTKVVERTENVKFPSLLTSFYEGLKSLTDPEQAKQHAGETELQDYSELSGDACRFPLQVGQCIFHTSDAVRIFWRDPFDPKQWYFGFTGTVSDWKEHRDEYGRRTVTLMIEDALRSFRKSRIITNWQIQDIKVIENTAFDDKYRTWHADNFSDLTVPEIFYTMTFGSDLAGEVAKKKFIKRDGTTQTEQIRGVNIGVKHYGVNADSATTTSAPEDGVGVFNFRDSTIYTIGPAGRVKEFTVVPTVNSVGSKAFHQVESLEEWQSTIDHVVPTSITDILALVPSDLQSKASESLDASASGGIVPVEIAMKEIGEHPELYPVDFGRLMMLLPNSLGPGTNRDILTKDLVQGCAGVSEFQTRLSILFNIVDRIDFALYASPRGDVIVEMPLYSFRPEDFGKFQSRYTFLEEDTINFESHFSEEKVHTQFRMPYWLVKNLKTAGNSDQIWNIPGTVNLKSLIPLFGVVSISGDPWGFISSKEAATYYANIKLSQLNADAWAQNVSTVMHLGIGPNRPCYFEARDFIATVRGAINSITWGMGGSVQQTLALNYRRGWSGQMTADKNKVYEPFGGRASHPLDYSMMFQHPNNKSSGNTKTLGEAIHAPISDAAKAANEAKIRAVMDKIAAKYIENERTAGRSPQFFTGRDISGSLGRTEEENARVGGDPDSKHLDNAAIDIPVSKMGSKGVDPDRMAATIISMKRNGEIPDTQILWRVEDHFDHIHVGLRGDTAHLTEHREDGSS